MTDANNYKNEIDALGKVLNALASLERDGQLFVMRSAANRLGLDGSEIGIGASGADAKKEVAQNGQKTSKDIPPKRFMDDKKPTKDVERVACLAYYLTYHRDQSHFKTADVTKMNTDAAQTAFSNTSVAVNNAEAAGYITKAGKRGEKQITAFGEKLVDAMPDTEEMKGVMAAESKRHARRRKNKKAAKKRTGK